MVSVGTPFSGNMLVLKFIPKWTPVFIRNLPSLNNLYRAQNRKVQGLPSNAKRISGSMENRSPPNESRNSTAGLPKEKLGTSEMPLLVMLAAPEKCWIVLLLSLVCEKHQSEVLSRLQTKKVRFDFIYMHLSIWKKKLLASDLLLLSGITSAVLFNTWNVFINFL